MYFLSCFPEDQRVLLLQGTLPSSSLEVVAKDNVSILSPSLIYFFYLFIIYNNVIVVGYCSKWQDYSKKKICKAKRSHC